MEILLYSRGQQSSGPNKKEPTMQYTYSKKKIKGGFYAQPIVNGTLIVGFSIEDYMRNEVAEFKVAYGDVKFYAQPAPCMEEYIVSFETLIKNPHVFGNPERECPLAEFWESFDKNNYGANYRPLPTK